ncbi:MAG: tetratricopeptide repeat protein [Planctomycetota bacterium]
MKRPRRSTSSPRHVGASRRARPHRASAALAAAALALAACAAPTAPAPGEPPLPDAPDGGAPAPVATSLLGAPLVPSPLPPRTRRRLELDLESARMAFEDDPTELRAVWVGRRLAYLGRYDEAIDWYRAALRDHPRSYRLRRHLGHRLITVRRIDEAVDALTVARALAASAPNRVEPDGAPGPTGEPRSTTHGNIDYHLALGHYARGEFDAAADLWLGCARRWATNDDSRVAAIHWAYMSLLRAGRTAEAARALDLVGPEPDVIENFAYLDLVELYRGDVSAEALLERDSPGAALEYGLARHLIRTGDTVRGERMLEALTARPDWPAFGVLGAEADLSRR